MRKSIMDGRYFIFETTGGALKMPWSDGNEDENTEILEIYATDEKTGKEFKMLNVKWTKQQ